MTCVARFVPGHSVRLPYLHWPLPASCAVVLLHAGLVAVDAEPESDPPANARIAAEIRNRPEEFASFETALAAAREANPRVPVAVLRRRVEWETRQLGNGCVGWGYDKLTRDQRRTGGHGVAASGPLAVLRGGDASHARPARRAQRRAAGDRRRAMRDVMPHGRLVTISGAGHMVFEEQAEATIRTLRAFITEDPSC
jgi:pimeloyl-ACP methyl ester carboxylesterase